MAAKALRACLHAGQAVAMDGWPPVEAGAVVTDLQDQTTLFESDGDIDLGATRVTDGVVHRLLEDQKDLASELGSLLLAHKQIVAPNWQLDAVVRRMPAVRRFGVSVARIVTLKNLVMDDCCLHFHAIMRDQ